MTILKSISILILITAAFLNAAALGEQYGLKQHVTKSTVAYRVSLFAVDLVLAVFVSRA